MEGLKELYGGFRKCIIPADDCVFIEADFCVDPKAKILKTDLTWVEAENLKDGDELIGLEDQLRHGNKFKSSVVTAIRRISRPRVKVTTTEGEVVVATDHPFVARKWKSCRQWIKAKDLQPGMGMAFLSKPWIIDETREAGYLAGFFDGEGWLSKTKVGFGQNPGETLERVRKLLVEKGHEFIPNNNSSTAQTFESGGMRTAMQFIGSIRPPRLLAKARSLWEGRRSWGKKTKIAVVIRVETIEAGPVIALETTAKTFISDGYFSHNSGIEAVETGWLARDIEYIRLANLGVHAYLTSHHIKKPASLKWSNEDLAAFFKDLKKKEKVAYDRCKHVVHGTNYGLTPHGMVDRYPEEFPTKRIAEELQNLYFDICPKLKAWQDDTRTRAHTKGYLGLKDHPFRYRRWFWNVYNSDGRPGLDYDKSIAFMPSSIAAGVLYETCLRLLDPEGPNYIGDIYHGQTPVRALIHDSILLEVPRGRCEDRVIEALSIEMTRPIDGLRHVGESPDLPIVASDPTWGSQPCPPEWGLGPFLSIGIEIARGDNWLDMEPISMGKLETVAADTVRDEDEDEDDK